MQKFTLPVIEPSSTQKSDPTSTQFDPRPSSSSLARLNYRLSKHLPDPDVVASMRILNQPLERSWLLSSDTYDEVHGVDFVTDIRNMVADRFLTRNAFFETSEQDITALAKPNFHQTNTVILVEVVDTMYDYTPHLAVDELVAAAREMNPHWNYYSVTLFSDTQLNPGHVAGNICVQRFSQQSEQWLECSPSYFGLSQFSLSGILEDCNPTIVGITGDSKTFFRARDALHDSLYDFSNSLVVGGGIAAYFSAGDILEAEVIRIDEHARDKACDSARPFIDMLYYERLGQEAFSDLVLTMSFPDSQLSQTLASYPGTITSIQMSAYLGLDPVQFQLNQRDKQEQESSITPLLKQQRLARWGDELVIRAKTVVGCPYRCSFCATAEPTSYSLTENITLLCDSIMEQAEIGGLDLSKSMLYFEDANFGGIGGMASLKHAQEILRITSQYPDLRLGIQVRFDNLTDEYIQQLKQGNVKYAFLGLESIDPGVRKSMNKSNKLTPEAMYQVLQGLHDAEIDYLLSMIIGYEGDTPESQLATASFACHTAASVIAVEPAKVYPGARDSLSQKLHHPIPLGTRYLLGIDVITDPRLGPENIGCVLAPSLSELDALSGLERISRCITQRVEYRDPGFSQISASQYEEVRTGFFKKSSAPKS